MHSSLATIKQVTRILLKLHRSAQQAKHPSLFRREAQYAKKQKRETKWQQEERTCHFMLSSVVNSRPASLALPTAARTKSTSSAIAAAPSSTAVSVVIGLIVE